MKKVTSVMGKVLSFAVVMVIAVGCAGEKSEKQVEQPKKPEVVYEEVQVQPMFVGGDAAMQKFIEENLQYPADAKSKGIQGEVVVKCMINNEGRVIETQVGTSVDPELDEEALRVVSLMPAFNPGMIDGACVAMWHTVAVKFEIK
ncbi:MAG: energy transducer TonB [Bacteroidales bacterium]|nr:energy transducer TonB [Bacteroidales bacterium]